MRHVLIFAILLLSSLPATCQNIDFSALVSFSYDGETLHEVLEDLSERYGLKFSYSRQVLPLDMQIYAEVENEPFAEALEILFEGTPVIYGFIADQLILSIDPVAYMQPAESSAPDDSMIAITDEVHEPRVSVSTPAGLAMTPVSFTMEPATIGTVSIDKEFIESEQRRLVAEAERQNDAFNVQMTLVPPAQISTQSNTFQPVNFSVNVLWGVNNALDGFEVGTLVNLIETDVQGVQMSGLYNGVYDNLRGAQFAGVINTAGERADGLQMAGLANSAGGGDVAQLSGLVNVSKGNTLGQASGLVNVAENVKHVQMTSLLNIAGNANVQIGLINVADSVKTAIGLFSFAKNGYRSLELAGEEALHANLNFRMGVRSFYTILHLGSTIDFTSWSVGMGFGGSVRTGRKGHYLQIEVLSRQMNENEAWTEETNLLNQFNLFWDARIGSQGRITFGPTFNVAVSRLYDADNDMYGTSLAPSWTFYDRTALDSENQEVNVKMWIGFHVGIRLNSKEVVPQRYQMIN